MAGRDRNRAPRRPVAVSFGTEEGHDPNSPCSPGYAERHALTVAVHSSGFTIETLGRPLPVAPRL
jgi:hypothetical protein